MKKILIIVGLFFIIIGIFCFNNSAPFFMKEQIFTVNHGDSISKAAYNLEKNNLITNKKFFKGLSYLLRRTYIRAGKYKIYEGMSSREILYKLSRGEVLTKRVTIPEGFNIYQIAERMDAEGICSSGKFLHYALDKSFLKSMGLPYPSVEGYLFPDTYVFAEESDARDVIAAMHNKMKKVLRSLGTDEFYNINIKTHRMLILASLVEKEAKVHSERVYVSSVFHNRLKRNMRMDCDPTVRYAVKKFEGRITYRDLESDSPYNTYRRKGLPPTPICSPGKQAILAAINPKKTTYLYFVARNDGSHYFSKRLSEHNKAVNYYQKGIKGEFVDNQILK